MDQKSNEPHAKGMRFLKTIRLSRGYSQYEMANFLKIRLQTYINWESRVAGKFLESLADLRDKLELDWKEFGKLIDDEVKDKRKRR